MPPGLMEPAWNVLVTRKPIKTDPPEVHEAGLKVLRMFNRPQTYGTCELWVKDAGARNIRRIEPEFYSILPAVEVEAELKKCTAEVENARLVLADRTPS